MVFVGCTKLVHSFYLFCQFFSDVSLSICIGVKFLGEE